MLRQLHGQREERNPPGESTCLEPFRGMEGMQTKKGDFIRGKAHPKEIRNSILKLARKSVLGFFHGRGIEMEAGERRIMVSWRKYANFPLRKKKDFQTTET